LYVPAYMVCPRVVQGACIPSGGVFAVGLPDGVIDGVAARREKGQRWWLRASAAIKPGPLKRRRL